MHLRRLGVAGSVCDQRLREENSSVLRHDWTSAIDCVLPLQKLGVPAGGMATPMKPYTPSSALGSRTPVSPSLAVGTPGSIQVNTDRPPSWSTIFNADMAQYWSCDMPRKTPEGMAWCGMGRMILTYCNVSRRCLVFEACSI